MFCISTGPALIITHTFQGTLIFGTFRPAASVGKAVGAIVPCITTAGTGRTTSTFHLALVTHITGCPTILTSRLSLLIGVLLKEWQHDCKVKLVCVLQMIDANA